MPYTVKMATVEAVTSFMKLFEKALEKEGSFALPKLSQIGPAVEFRIIRKKTPSEYCGQHPGPCLVPVFREPKKQKNRLLEWDDWVRFHGIVNDVLDAMGAAADVWSKPMEAVPMPGTGPRSRFWIRRGTLARIKYDWEEDWQPGRFTPTRLWNMGSMDQFKAAV